MKKYVVFLILILFITGCGNKEEKPKADILDFDTGMEMTNSYEYEMFKYKMIIHSEYLGKPYNNTIFSFMVDNNLGMYLFNYHSINKDNDKNLYKYSFVINNKEYHYYIDGDTLMIIYNLDNEYSLLLSIKSLNNDFSNLYDLFNYFDFDIYEK
ncbi:MAG: hypothetical protein J6X02_00435 [Bacilli bacterium]|nr:hypothetical protein [Bacilli bacterium]